MKKKARRVLTCLVALTIMITLISGCGGSTGTDGSTQSTAAATQATTVAQTTAEPKVDLGGREIKYGAWWDLSPQNSNGGTGNSLIDRIKDMEAKYNFKLKYVNIPNDQYVQNLTASIMAGDPAADVFYLEDKMFYPGFVTKGLLYPLSDLKEFNFDDRKWEQYARKMATYKGKVYGFVGGTNFPTNVVLFNKKIFAQEGITEPYALQKEGNWTWDKFLEIAQKTTKDTNGDGVTDQWGITGMDASWMFVYSNGGNVINEVDGKKTFSLGDEKSLEALQFYQDLCAKYKVYEVNKDGAAWDYAAQQFQDGKSAMFMGPYWLVTTRYKDNMTDDYGVLFAPKGPKADAYRMPSSGNTIAVFAHNVKDPEKMAYIWNKYFDPFPEYVDNNGIDQTWKTDYAVYNRDDESLVTLEKLVADAGSIYVPNEIPCYADIQNMWYDVAYKLEHGAGTPKELINGMTQKAQGIIDDVETGTK